MTLSPKFSVAVVSFERPDYLRRCLLGLSQLFYRSFETIVVADRDSLDAISDLPFAQRLKLTEQIEPNISSARNQAIAMAAGDILAFIDDDAVPEPTWLDHMAAAFLDPKIDAAGGHVLGRNGISYQWKSRVICPDGSERPLDVNRDTAIVPTLGAGEALKLEGTNFAVRRKCFDEIGGFDAAFAYFLDDTDFAVRLSLLGSRVAAVPAALVHHGQAPDRRRSGNRAPKSLFEIGASTAVFARKHRPDESLEDTKANVMRAQTQRLHRFLRDGFLEPRDLRPLLSGLAAGFEFGRLRPLQQTTIAATDLQNDFRPTMDDPAPSPMVLTGPWQDRRALSREAAEYAANGHSVCVVSLSPTALAHRMGFTDSGVWQYSGGQFGRAERDHRRLQFWANRRRRQKISADLARIRNNTGKK